MIPREIIELAVKGGWSNINCPNCLNPWTGHKQTRIGNRYCTTGPDFHRTVLDPTFWAALGKSCRWDDIVGGYHGNFNTNLKCVTCNAHRFYDLVLIGQSTDLFWQEILGKENNHE